jgi:hypothetical protein
MAWVLGGVGLDAGSVSASIGEQHVYVIVKLDENEDMPGVWEVDIHPSTYETGGGYTWRKKVGVVFEPADISVHRISEDPKEFEQYMLDEQAPYDNSTSRMRDLPGFPQMNALVNPQSFVPANDHPRNVDPISGKKAEYLGPTLDGVPLMTDNHTKDPQDDPDKELDALLGDLAPPENEDGRDPHEEENLILHRFVEACIEETLKNRPNGAYPNRQGWKNTQVNSLAWRKNQINPEQDPPEMWHKTFEDPKDHNPPVDNIPPPPRTPGYGFGAIGFPKQFVPKDYEQANPDYDEIIKDPIGRRRLTLPPDETDERVGVNASIREVFTTTATNEDISEMGFRNREDWDEHPSEHGPKHGDSMERNGETRIWSETHGVWLTPEDWESAHGHEFGDEDPEVADDQGVSFDQPEFPEEELPLEDDEEPDFDLSLEYPEEDIWEPSGMDEQGAVEQLADEEFKSQAQRGLFYARAAKPGPEGKKWTKLAKEFERETPKGKKLPQKVTREQLMELAREIVKEEKSK